MCNTSWDVNYPPQHVAINGLTRLQPTARSLPPVELGVLPKVDLLTWDSFGSLWQLPQYLHLLKSPGNMNIFPVVIDSLSNQQGQINNIFLTKWKSRRHREIVCWLDGGLHLTKGLDTSTIRCLSSSALPDLRASCFSVPETTSAYCGLLQWTSSKRPSQSVPSPKARIHILTSQKVRDQHPARVSA